jgi:hypothetical protein
MYRKVMTDTDAARGRDSEPPSGPPPMPRWVKAFIAAVVIVVLLFLGSMLFGVRHGPGRHAAEGRHVVAAAPAHL